MKIYEKSTYMKAEKYEEGRNQGSLKNKMELINK